MKRRMTISERRKSQSDMYQSDSDNSANSDTGLQRSSRMSKNDEEIFVALCVEHFEKIGDMSTIRGTPASSNVKKVKNQTQEAWKKIANDMNQRTNVSKIFNFVMNEILKQRTFQSGRSLDYYKKKFKNVKENA